MNPDAQFEASLTQAPSSIEVDEDALSPRFRAQMEAVLAPLSVLLILALFVFHFRKTAKKVATHE